MSENLKGLSGPPLGPDVCDLHVSEVSCGGPGFGGQNQVESHISVDNCGDPRCVIDVAKSKQQVDIKGKIKHKSKSDKIKGKSGVKSKKHKKSKKHHSRDKYRDFDMSNEESESENGNFDNILSTMDSDLFDSQDLSDTDLVNQGETVQNSSIMPMAMGVDSVEHDIVSLDNQLDSESAQALDQVHNQSINVENNSRSVAMHPSKKRKMQASDVSDSQSDSDSNEWSGSSEDGEWSEDTPSVLQTASSGRFDPLANSNKHAWKLNEGQQAFCDKYFTKYVGESALKKDRLKKDTLPGSRSP